MTFQDELQVILELHGGVLPARAVVDWAREHPDSALHKRFDWEDSVAAEKWRVHQARNIIAEVRIEAAENREYRGFVSLEADRQAEHPVYLPTVRVLQDADKRRQLVAQVARELKRIRDQHRQLVELAAVWAAVDGLE